MLAQNYLTAEQLGIDKDIHAALVKLHGMFLRDEIPEELFDMKRVGNPDCGTPGCIWGWCRALNPGAWKVVMLDSICSQSPGLRSMFLPGAYLTVHGWAMDHQNAAITCRDVNKACTVLGHYLRTGEDAWPAVMEGREP